MSHRDEPERLLTAGGSDLERRLIGAIAHERPSDELRERMAQAIGVPLATLGAAASVAATKTGAAAAKAAAGASGGLGPGALLPWISAGVVGLAVAGAIVGVSVWKSSPAMQPPALESAPAAPALVAPAEAIPAPLVETPAYVPAPPPKQRTRVGATTNNLRDQIALIDGARTAVAGSAGERALDLVRQYQSKYPAGTFRPEAAALKIEALAKLGRTAEARALAERFLADYGESPQTDRVLQVAGRPGP
jgi:hypothetical protein